MKTSSDTNWNDNFIMLGQLTLGARRAVYFYLCPSTAGEFHWAANIFQTKNISYQNTV